jgi:hypothetical protein
MYSLWLATEDTSLYSIDYKDVLHHCLTYDILLSQMHLLSLARARAASHRATAELWEKLKTSLEEVLTTFCISFWLFFDQLSGTVHFSL